MKTDVAKTHKKNGIKVYVPTAIASSESTGGGGNEFERQMQTLFAVLMLCDGELAFAPSKKISKVQFQTRKSGYNVDDARLELVDGAGGVSQILIQIKRTIKFVWSCEDFTDTIQAAWIDFQNKNKFNPNTDKIALVVGPLCDKDRGLLDWLFWYAQTRDRKSFIDEMQTGAGISKDRRCLFDLIAEIVHAQDSDVAEMDVVPFINCLRICCPDTVYGDGLLASFAISLIRKHFPNSNADKILKCIEEIVGKYNAIGGELTKDSLIEKLQFFNLQAIEAAESAGKSLPKSTLNAVMNFLENSRLRRDHLALLILVGAWDDSMPNDRGIVCQCLGVTSDDLDDLIQPLQQSNPSLIVAEAGIIRVRRRREIWRQTASAVSITEISRLTDIVIRQFSHVDNSLDVAPEDRHVSCYERSGHDASKVLREGLAHGMALFAAEVNYCKQIPFDERQALPVKLLRKILDGHDWRIWATLDDVLPYLAEVAPMEYIALARRFSQRKTGGMACLYGQERCGALGRTYILGLVNSLSILAWFPESLAEALQVLGEMAKLDPSGQWHPRPIDVFQKALHPLAPHTWASAKRRVEIATALIKRLDRHVAWEALASLLPGGFFSYIKDDVGPLYRRQGRTTDVEKIRKEGDEQWQFEQYCCLAIPLAGKDPERLKCLENCALRCWGDTAFNRFIEHLRKIRNGLSGDARYVVWRSICHTLNHVRLSDEQNGKVDWNHPRLKAYCLLEKEYEPDDDRFRALLLFSWEDMHQCRKTTDNDRANAIRGIHQRYGIGAVFDVAGKSDRPGVVGEAFGLCGNSDTDQILLPGRLGSEDSVVKSFVSGYVRERFAVGGWLWAEGIVSHGWTQDQMGALLAVLPFGRDTWDRVTVLLKGAEEQYWMKIRYPYVENEQDLQAAIDGLLLSGCGYVALDLVGHHLMQEHKIPTELSMKVLRTFVSNKVTDTPTSMSCYSLSHAIKNVQDDEDISTSEKAAIEWYFIDSADWIGDHGFRPKALECELMSNPQFFCEALRIAYLPAKQAKRIKAELKEHPHSEQASRRIRNVWKLLYNCHRIPGITKDGNFSDKLFAAWIRKIFSMARKEDRLSPAKNVIAQTLIYAPKDANGFWMPRVIAELLEKRGNESMLTHYRIAMFNSRGAHFVDKTGKEDRELAEKYNAMAEDAEKEGYFGLAREMRSLANSILADAARMQEDDKALDAYFAVKREERGGK